MTIPTTAISETTPAGDSNIALGDNRIREYKTQNREILEVDHNYPSSGQDVDAGKHKKVSLIEQADIGTGDTGLPILGAQTVSGKPELMFTDEDDNDVQITSGGSIKGDSIKVSNNTYLKSKDAAGTGTVDLIKADANDVAVVPDGTQTATNAAPVDDKDIANKKYVDDTVSTNALNFDTPSSKTAGTSYQASTDGFIYGYCTNAGAGIDMDLYTDSNSTPTTQVGKMQFGTTTSMSIPFCFPIKSGNYYRIVNTAGTLNAYYFMGKA